MWGKDMGVAEIATREEAEALWRAWRHHSTGGEGKSERVKRTATVAPGSTTARNRSRAPVFFRPTACPATRTPAMGGRSGNVSGASGERARAMANGLLRGRTASL